MCFFLASRTFEKQVYSSIISTKNAADRNTALDSVALLVHNRWHHALLCQRTQQRVSPGGRLSHCSSIRMLMILIVFLKTDWSEYASYWPRSAATCCKYPAREDLPLGIWLLTVSSATSWLCTLLHQYRPLIGPQLTGETAQILQYLWGNKFE